MVVISHNLADVFEVADRIFVLRLGRAAGDFDAEQTTEEQSSPRSPASATDGDERAERRRERRSAR